MFSNDLETRPNMSKKRGSADCEWFYHMKNFRISNYQIRSPKLRGLAPAVFLHISDVHLHSFDARAHFYLSCMRKENPDAILVTGDMNIGREHRTLLSSARFLIEAQKIAPVYYELGNHEYKLRIRRETSPLYERYEDKLRRNGITVLHNESAVFEKAGNTFRIHGLELPMVYYRKGLPPRHTGNLLNRLLGRCPQEEFQILLAHNPRYGQDYLAWGADLTLAGHYHGGVMHLGENRGLISPQFIPFPGFACGMFEQDGRHMIVSSGMGEHTVTVRINNPRELVVIRISGDPDKD